MQRLLSIILLALPRHRPPTSTAGAGFVSGGFDPDGPRADPHYPSPYPPEHTTFDLSLGKTFTDKLSVPITATKIANHRVLLDNSLTFGGFHYNDPVRSTANSITALSSGLNLHL